MCTVGSKLADNMNEISGVVGTNEMGGGRMV